MLGGVFSNPGCHDQAVLHLVFWPSVVARTFHRKVMRNVDNWRPCVQPSDEQMLDEARLGERSWASLR
jgi:hypothetical protein